MFGLGAGEMLIIVAFALIFIGPKKLPELARNLGKGLREFQKAKDDFMHHVEHEKSEINQQLADVNGEQETHDPKLTGVHEPHQQESSSLHSEISEEEIKNEMTAMEEALNKSAQEADTTGTEEKPQEKDS